MPLRDENRCDRRVVVTGLGIVSAIGIGKEDYQESLKAGRCGIKQISSFDTNSYECRIAAEIPEFEPGDFMPAQTARRIDRFAQLGLAASRLSITDSALKMSQEDSERIGIILGTSLGTLCYAEQQIALFYEKGIKRINPFFATSVIPSSAVTQISIDLGIHGSCRTLTTACASGTAAVGEAFHRIRTGELDVILAGGAEAPITPLVLSTLSSMSLLSRRNDLPEAAYCAFSGEAQGFVLGEGSGVLVLEEMQRALRRDANIYAEVVGFAAAADAYHVMQFEPGLEQPVRALRSALNQAHIEPKNIGYINPHGIALPGHDRSEVEILKRVFGDAAAYIPVSATKPLTGHVLGGAGALELVACCLMLQREFLHPTINFTDSMPPYGLDFVPNESRNRKVDAMLSASFGFGGYNAACVIRRYPG